MKKILPFAVFLTAIKCYLALTLELGIDEAYYYSYLKPLQWSYFDHPFMLALLSWIATFGTHWTDEIFLRLFPLVFGFINPFILYAIAQKIGTSKSAFITSLLYLSTLYASIISGLFLLPDAPLSFFALVSIYFSIDFIQKNKTSSFLYFALFLALALASKYQAAFVGLAMAVFILKYRKNTMTKPYFYLALGIAFLGIIPTLIWNAEHHWINFSFHSNRIGSADLFEFLPREIIGQILYQNPIVFGLIIWAFTRLKKHRKLFPKPILIYLYGLSFPLVITALLISIFTPSLPHWSGIAYIGIVLIVGRVVSEYSFSTFVYKAAISLPILLLIIGSFAVNKGFIFNIIEQHQPISIKGKGDPTLDMFGWMQFRDEFLKFQSRENHPTNLIVAQRWYPAGHLDYYLARNSNNTVITEGPLFETHQYAFRDNAKFWKENHNRAYFIAQSTSSFRPENYKDNRFSFIPKDTIYIRRNRDTVRTHFVYLMRKND